MHVCSYVSSSKERIEEITRLVMQQYDNLASRNQGRTKEDVDSERSKLALLAQVIAQSARSLFAPSITIVGGLLAQEALKTCGQQRPLQQQIFFHDATDMLDPAILQSSSVIADKHQRSDTIWDFLGSSVKDRLDGMRVLMCGLSPQNIEAAKCLTLLGACDDTKEGKLFIANSGKRVLVHQLASRLEAHISQQ